MDTQQLARLQTIAGRHGGVFSTGEAAEHGIGIQVLQRALRAGALGRLHSSVWRFPAVPLTQLQRIWGSVLQVGPEARASHEASLYLHGVRHFELSPVVLVPPGSNHQYAGIRVHRKGDLLVEHEAVVQGIPTTTLPRALVDVASVFSRRRLEDVFDRVTVTQRATSTGAVARVLRQVNRHGRKNIRDLQGLLDDRRPAEPAPRSKVERRVDELIAGTDLPEPCREYPHPGWELGSAFVDRAWPDAMLILEVDGRTWHAREHDMAKDRARDRAAGRLGWHTMRVLDEEVHEVPEAIRDDIVATYERRRAQLGG